MNSRPSYDRPYARSSLRQDQPPRSASSVHPDLGGPVASPQIAIPTPTSPLHPLIASPTSSSRAEHPLPTLTIPHANKGRGREAETDLESDERYYGRRIGPSESGSRGQISNMGKSLDSAYSCLNI
jgi:hypothetical protein